MAFAAATFYQYMSVVYRDVGCDGQLVRICQNSKFDLGHNLGSRRGELLPGGRRDQPRVRRLGTSGVR